MADDEISKEGREARFAQWEKLGLDAIKQDLATGGYRLVGGPPQVRALAREWVRLKETEHTAQQTVDTEEILRGLGLVSASVSDFLNGDRNTELDRLARAATRAQDLGSTAMRVHQEQPAPPPAEKSVELLTLKPGIWGMSIDLKEAARRLRRRFKKS